METDRLISMRYMLRESRIGTVILPSMGTSNVKYMSGLFYNAFINDMDWKNLNTKSTIDMSNMFYKCNINNTDLSGFNTSKVENMDKMFEGCILLEKYPKYVDN